MFLFTDSALKSNSHLLFAIHLGLFLCFSLARRAPAVGELPPIALGRVVLGVAACLLEGALQVRHRREEARVDDRAEVGRLVDDARHDVVVRDGRDLRRRVALLLPDNVENRLLFRGE